MLATRRLRPYQVDAERCAFEAFASVQSTLCCLPTGTGKTTFAASFAGRYLTERGGRAMVLIHMEEQVAQWQSELEAFGLTVGVEKAERGVDEGVDRPQVVISSVPTIRLQRRRGRFKPEQFSLVIPDEGHHGTAPSWKATRDYFAANPQCRFLYLTATPQRGDGTALHSVCDSVAYHYDLVSAIDDGWLVPVHSKVVTVTSLDFSWIDRTQGDLSLPQLQREMTEKVGHLHAVARPTIENCGEEATIIYCSGVDHARRLADTLNAYKPVSAVCLSGATSKEERRCWVTRFLEGRVQFLCVFGLFLEAFNAPKVSRIVMARATLNQSLYLQMLGRGTRTWPGALDGLEDAEPTMRQQRIAASPKPSMLVLDFAGNCGKHDICRATDLLAGAHGHGVQEYARRLMEEPNTGSRPVKDVVAHAVAEVAKEEERRKKVAAIAHYRMLAVDPFRRSRTSHAGGLAKPALPATPAQVSVLVSLGVRSTFACACDRNRAKTIIRKLRSKRGKGVRFRHF